MQEDWSETMTRWRKLLVVLVCLDLLIGGLWFAELARRMYTAFNSYEWRAAVGWSLISLTIGLGLLFGWMGAEIGALARRTRRLEQRMGAISQARETASISTP